MKISDENLIELCKETCTLHRTSDDGEFHVWFELDTLKNFIEKLNSEDCKYEVAKPDIMTYHVNTCMGSEQLV